MFNKYNIFFQDLQTYLVILPQIPSLQYIWGICSRFESHHRRMSIYNRKIEKEALNLFFFFLLLRERKKGSGKLYNLFAQVLCFLTQCIILSISYTAVWKVLWIRWTLANGQWGKGNWERHCKQEQVEAPEALRIIYIWYRRWQAALEVWERKICSQNYEQGRLFWQLLVLIGHFTV